MRSPTSPRTCARSLGQRGSILIHIIIGIVALGVLGAAMSQLYSESSVNVSTENHATRARYMAEGGLRYAQGELEAAGASEILGTVQRLNDTGNYTLGNDFFNLSVGGWSTIFADSPVSTGDKVGYFYTDLGYTPQSFCDNIQGKDSATTNDQIVLVRASETKQEYDQALNEITVDNCTVTAGGLIRLELSDAVTIGKDEAAFLGVKYLDKANKDLYAGSSFEVSSAARFFPEFNGYLWVKDQNGQPVGIYYDRIDCPATGYENCVVHISRTSEGIDLSQYDTDSYPSVPPFRVNNGKIVVLNSDKMKNYFIKSTGYSGPGWTAAEAVAINVVQNAPTLGSYPHEWMSSGLLEEYGVTPEDFPSEDMRYGKYENPNPSAPSSFYEGIEGLDRYNRFDNNALRAVARYGGSDWQLAIMHGAADIAAQTTFAWQDNVVEPFTLTYNLSPLNGFTISWQVGTSDVLTYQLPLPVPLGKSYVVGNVYIVSQIPYGSGPASIHLTDLAVDNLVIPEEYFGAAGTGAGNMENTTEGLAQWIVSQRNQESAFAKVTGNIALDWDAANPPADSVTDYGVAIYFDVHEISYLPTITSITPQTGTTAGGTNITTNFAAKVSPSGSYNAVFMARPYLNTGNPDRIELAGINLSVNGGGSTITVDSPAWNATAQPVNFWISDENGDHSNPWVYLYTAP
ncbi:IPT/TIG domain-containing protein [Oceanidesulfovibrio marinus]|uniref:Uncharacterized protein n=1 Tax=Oceanidesulfovibrio marinus TaxID=370038 RepID=A0A6P1ZPL1_9BACT|nr:IPT/TIG domain-containing protein [Oceanidesulfovibrio marinus]QJT09104.1 hypothetical protein E8L03_09230 [Oceanidesulfovibrio marinus]TVM36468.1 hypothetical protein DQK91_00650 [Oceanidesulfovibrio marinus]